VRPAPAVSCVIIFLNEERFLAEAIGSVLAQDHESWELLLVDDGSTDGSAEMARTYVSRHPDRIRYLQHAGGANLGMSASRNLGLARARGRYVGFLDADDVWLPEKLGEQIAILDGRPDVGMVYGRTLLWHSWQPAGTHRSLDHFCDLGVTPETVVDPPRLLVQLIENRFQTPTTCNALVRRSVIDAVGGFEPAFRGMFEDQVFFMKVCLDQHVYVASRCWAKYRQRDDSHSAQAHTAAQVAEARARLLAWLEAYLEQRDVNSTPVWKALRREQFALRSPRLHRHLQRLQRLHNSVTARWRA
jgi:glycosyltransferase involved in cell wall biosynthesis